MKTHLISGGCGFVGRNMVKRLYKNDLHLHIKDVAGTSFGSVFAIFFALKIPDNDSDPIIYICQKMKI